MPDQVRELRRSIRERLEQAADPARAPQMQAYMKSSMPFLGVSAVPLRAICREELAAMPLEGRDTWERGVRTLWDEAEFREERYAAIALAGHRFYRVHQDPSTLPLYRHLVVTGA